MAGGTSNFLLGLGVAVALGLGALALVVWRRRSKAAAGALAGSTGRRGQPRTPQPASPGRGKGSAEFFAHNPLRRARV